MAIRQLRRYIGIGLASLASLVAGEAYAQSGRTVNFLGEPLEIVVSTNTGRTARTANGRFNLDEVTGIAELGGAPAAYALSQNYPNPFNPSTRIKVNTLRKGRMGVYDLLGREIDAIEIAPGQHVVQWEPDNVVAGIYLYRFAAPGFSQAGKMTLIDGSGSGRGLSLVSSAYGALGKETAESADITFSGPGIETLTLKNIPAGADLGDVVLNQDAGIVAGYLGRIADHERFIRNVLRHVHLRNNNLAEPEQIRTTDEVTAVDRSNDLGRYVTVLFDTTTADTSFEVYANAANNPATASLLRQVPRDSLIRIGNRDAIDVPAGGASAYYWVKHGGSMHGPNLAVPLDNSSPMRADLNGNGTVDVLDIAVIAQIFANRAEYDPAVDLNADGDISILDIAAIATVFGRGVVRENERYVHGNVRDLLAEHEPAVAGAVVGHGSAADTTDSFGRYLLRSAESAAQRLVISHPEYYLRETSAFAPLDTVVEETIVPKTFNMAFFDEVARFGGRLYTQRWAQQPKFYLVNVPLDTGIVINYETVPQAMIDTALTVIRKHLPKFTSGFVKTPVIQIGNDSVFRNGVNDPAFYHPTLDPRLDGWIVVHWLHRYNPGSHGEYLRDGAYGTEIVNALVRFNTANPQINRETYYQELFQAVGARVDNETKNAYSQSVFNDPDATMPQLHDWFLGKILYNRVPGNMSQDRDR